MSKKLEEELKERLHTRKLVDRNVSNSGCISRGFCYRVDDEKDIFVKTNKTLHARTMFDGEFESLKQIHATRTVRIPEPMLVVHNYDNKNTSALVMEFLEITQLNSDCAKKLGKCMASLHDYNNKVIKFNVKASKWVGKKQPSARSKVHEKNDSSDDESEEVNQFAKHNMQIQESHKKEIDNNPDDSEFPNKFLPEPNTKEVQEFGFDIPTSCGSIPQLNSWTDDWVSFYSRNRLDKPIRSLLADHGDRELIELWSHLQLKVDKFFRDYDRNSDDKIVPALLHGDLWSGNAAQLDDGTNAVIYDPASFYGHNEYEFGIARMFGGISKDFETAYFEVMPKKKLFEKRNELYQLFHHLNHWEHFGSSYRASSLQIMKDLNASVL